MKYTASEDGDEDGDKAVRNTDGEGASMHARLQSPSDVLEVDTYHRKVSTWLSDELQSINDSILQLKLSIPSESEPMMKLNSSVNSVEELLVQAKSKIAKSLLDVAAQQSGAKYSLLVADLEDLKNTLATLRKNLEKSLDLYPKTSGRSSSFLNKVRFARVVDRAVSTRPHFLDSAKTAQAKFRVSDRSLDLLLSSMGITAALEQAHLIEVRKLQADLQIFAVAEAPTHNSSLHSEGTNNAKELPQSSYVQYRASQELLSKVTQAMPSILDRRFNPLRDLSMNNSNLARHRHLQSSRLNGTCNWLINSKEFWEQWLFARRGDCKTLFCWGGPGIGRSFLTSHLIDTLAGIKRVHAYYYLRQGGVHSAGRLVLSLLRQLCDLGNGFASDDLNTYLSDLDPFPSNPRTSEFLEMKLPHAETIGVEDSQETAARDYGATYRDLPMSEPLEGARGSASQSQVNIARTATYQGPDLENITVPSEADQLIETDRVAKFQFENFAYIQELNTASPPKLRPSLKILHDTLEDVFSTINKTVFIVIDAWDEENMEPTGISDFYAVLSKLDSLECKLFLTSRNEPSTQIPFTYIPLHISEYRNFKDLEVFARIQSEDFFKIFARASLVGVEIQPELEEIPQVIAKKSRGSFTSATLFVNILLSSFQNPKLRVRSSLNIVLRSRFGINPISLIGDIESKEQSQTLSQLVRISLQVLEENEPVIAIPANLILVWLASTKTPLSVTDLSIAIPNIYHRFLAHNRRLNSLLRNPDTGAIFERSGVNAFWSVSSKRNSSLVSLSLSGIVAEIAIYCIQCLLNV